MVDQNNKVIYICPNGFLGGAERFVLNAAIGHQEVGQWKPIIIFFNDGDALQEAQKKNVQTYLLKNKFRLLNPYKLFLALKEIRSIIVQENPGFLHATMAYGHIITWLASIFLPYKRLWFQHGPVDSVLDLIANQLPVDHIAYNSNYLKTLHHISLDERKLKALEEQYKIDNPFLLLSAGRITECKSYETIIDALHSLIANKNIEASKIKLLIIGSPTGKNDQQYEQKIHHLVQKYSLESIIQFLPFQANIHYFYALADCFIQSSKIPEPFGLTAAEAMKQGTFTIGCKQGGITEILQHEITGFTFESSLSSAPKELALALDEIIQDSQKREKLGLAGQKIVTDKLSIQTMINKLEEIYTSKQSK